jgi:hypothetical protein
MIFSGAPSLVAWAQRDSDYGQIIEFKDDESQIRLTATGFPPLQGVWMQLGTSEETGVMTNAKNPAGRAVSGKMWWDEEKKMLRGKVENPGDQIYQFQRHIDENDVLHLLATNSKPDGSSCSFECTFRRTG